MWEGSMLLESFEKWVLDKVESLIWVGEISLISKNDFRVCVKKNCVFGSGLMSVNGIEICTAEYASLS